MILAETIRKAFPSPIPCQRYCVFGGTNTFREWRQALSGWLFREPQEQAQLIAEYEERFAQAAEANHAVSFGAGRMAFYALMEALSVGPGDEVIIPAFTCVVVPNAILYRGATPVYVDIDPVRFNIDAEKVAGAISSKTRVIYAQHTFGVPCDLGRLREIGRRHGVPVIEDCGHALGARYEGRAVGGLGDAGYFTTDRSKNISTHLGGMVTTNDAGTARRLREIQGRTPYLEARLHRKLLRSFLVENVLFHPRAYWAGRPIYHLLNSRNFFFHFDDEMLTQRPTQYPYPCRMSAQQARVGSSQVALLPAFLRYRQQVAGWLEERIGWYGMSADEVGECAWLRYSFLVDSRAEFVERFRRRFDLGIWFTSVVEGRTSNLEAVGYESGSCPTAERVASQIVNLPTHPRVSFNVLRAEVAKNLDWIRSRLIRL